MATPVSSLTLRQLTGFKKTSNLTYYLTLSTISVAFIVWMYESMFIKSIYCNPSTTTKPAIAGECYWYRQPGSRYYWAIQLHLSTCFPALGLAILQFTPSIRQRYPRYHRWAGRTSAILSLTTTLSAFLLAKIAVGGTRATFWGTSTLGVLLLISHYKGWTAIRGGDINIHRRWMLRTWALLGSIITVRPMLGCILLVESKYRTYMQNYASLEISCARLVDMVVLGRSKSSLTNYNVFERYPECVRPELRTTAMTSLFQTQLDNKTVFIPEVILRAVQPETSVFVTADIGPGQIDQFTAAFSFAFGSAIWVSFIIHIILVELYLRKTKDEDERLKNVSDLRRRKELVKSERDNAAILAVDEKKRL